MLSKEASSIIFWVSGMTWHGIEPKFPGPLVNTLTARSMSGSFIYIHTHTVIQRQTFILSELFYVARHVGRSKLGSKPIQLYVRLSLRPLGLQEVGPRVISDRDGWQKRVRRTHAVNMLWWWYLLSVTFIFCWQWQHFYHINCSKF